MNPFDVEVAGHEAPRLGYVDGPAVIDGRSGRSCVAIREKGNHNTNCEAKTFFSAGISVRRTNMRHGVHPINRALAYLEENLAEDIRVGDIARHSGISRYHFSRVFAYATGYPLARYLRLRRLTEAAGHLLQSDRSILNIALDVGYDSHSVFGRAFNAAFGVSPSEFRHGERSAHVNLVQPILWSFTMNITVPRPRIEDGLSLTLVGLHERFTGDNEFAEAAYIEMRKRFWPAIPSVPHQLAPGPNFYQYVFDPKDEPKDEDGAALAFDFFMGVSVTEVDDLPEGLTHIEIHWNKYAAFPFSVKVAELKDFIMAILVDWFPQSDINPGDGSHIQWFKPDPHWKEPDADSAPDQDQRTEGEIWVPVK
jgi:AraC family transcriptional regulator